MGSEHYCLRWNNHQSNLLGVFSQLLHDESLVDVTLACSEGASIRAHKVVLSACSSYFQTLFLDHPSRHPIVILKDVHFAELRTLVEFMYKGEVNVQYCQLSALLKTAESLKVKGLAEMTNLNPSSSSTSTTSTAPPCSTMHGIENASAPTDNHQLSATNATTSNVIRNHRHHQQQSQQQSQQQPSPSSSSTASSSAQSQQQLNNSATSSSTSQTYEAHNLQSSSRLHMDTLTRHDRKTGTANTTNATNNHGSTDTADTSMKRLSSAHPEESYTPPPRLDVSQNPLPLVIGTRNRSGRSEPPDPGSGSGPGPGPGPGPGTTAMQCDDNETECSELGSNMNVPASCSSEPMRPVAAATVSCSAGGGGGGSSTQLSRSPPTPDPVPGPSGLLPVQQVPLSLKKEVDWERAVEEIKAEASSAEYLRLAHDQRETAARMMSTSAFTFPFHPPLLALLQHQQSNLGLGFRFNQLFAEDLLKHRHVAEEALRTTQPQEVPAVECGICFASFPSTWLLNQHTALQHVPSLTTTIASQSSGPGCSSTAQTIGEDKPFICDQCGQSYRYRSAYVKHREQNHRARLPADKLFTCDVCGMQFRYLKSFKKHRLNHALERLHGKTGGTATSTTSASENQVSSSSSEIVSSLPVEDDTASDQDDTADSATVSSQCKAASEPDQGHPEPDHDQVDEEIMDAEEPTPGRNLDIREASLLSYLRADAVSRQRERRFACPFCGKCVRSKENLKLHVRKHTGERPFVCLFCGRAFGGKSDLTRHLRIHTGERPYHCEACGKCFARADYLSKHLTTHIHNTPR